MLCGTRRVDVDAHPPDRRTHPPHPGGQAPPEGVGCIAAQSASPVRSSPSTRSTRPLSDQQVTLGIPRLTELVDATRSPKTPVHDSAPPHPVFGAPRIREYVAHLPLTRLGDV